MLVNFDLRTGWFCGLYGITFVADTSKASANLNRTQKLEYISNYVMFK